MFLSRHSRSKRVGLLASPLFCLALALLCSGHALAETLRLDGYRASNSINPISPGDMIEIEVEGELRKALADFSGKYTGREVFMRVDGKEVARPRIMSIIKSGKFQLPYNNPTPDFAEAVKQLLSGRATLEISTD